MRILPFVYALVCSGLVAQAAEPCSARNALEALPEGVISNLARVEGQEGTPNPERWYFLVYDQGAENGFREFVVAGDRLVAIREMSQFAEQIGPEDVVGPRALAIDSREVADLARRFAGANGRNVVSFNYELRKDDVTGKAVWTVHCIDGDGSDLGKLAITSGKGTIVARDGFVASSVGVQSNSAGGSVPLDPIASDEQFLRHEETADGQAQQNPPPVAARGGFKPGYRPDPNGDLEGDNEPPVSGELHWHRGDASGWVSRNGVIIWPDRRAYDFPDDRDPPPSRSSHHSRPSSERRVVQPIHRILRSIFPF